MLLRERGEKSPLLKERVMLFEYKFEDKKNTSNFVWVESSVPFPEDEDFCYNQAEDQFIEEYGYYPKERNDWVVMEVK